MYLGYLDDSGTHDKAREWQVICAVLIPADSYLAVEFMSALTVDNLMPEDRRDQFEEFHAWELYGGYGIFDGIDQGARHGAIHSMLSLLGSSDFKVAYGAVNLKQHRKSYFGSAPAYDVAFRRCVIGASEWIGQRVMEDLKEGQSGARHSALFIMDELDGKSRATLLGSLRDLRARFRFSGAYSSSLPFVHDDMYFGDSKFSIGIQIADLCSYFIAKHLAGDEKAEVFYKMIEPHIISEVREE